MVTGLIDIRLPALLRLGASPLEVPNGSYLASGGLTEWVVVALINPAISA